MREGRLRIDGEQDVLFEAMLQKQQ